MLITIVVPTHNDSLLPLNSMINMFGGVTVTKSQGYWKDAQGVVVFDNVSTLASYTHDYTPEDIYILAVKVCKLFSQDCVLFTIGDNHFFATQEYDSNFFQ